MRLLPEKKQEEKQSERLPYEAPAIVHEGAISTRAGTPLIFPDGDNGNDATDLFGS